MQNKKDNWSLKATCNRSPHAPDSVATCSDLFIWEKLVKVKENIMLTLATFVNLQLPIFMPLATDNICLPLNCQPDLTTLF